ncbi:MAG: ATP-dependent Clp protease proteolytic subunit [Nitrososphaeria archaeon]
MTNTVAIRFFTPVNEKSIAMLMSVIDVKFKQGIRDFVLLIASVGGETNAGLAAYNYLKGLPINLTTHNMGNVESAAVTMYCAGKTRLATPNSKFMIHPVALTLNGQFNQEQLNIFVSQIEADITNMSKIIADTAGTNIKETRKMMKETTVLSSEEALKLKLVTEIKQEFSLPEDAEIISIDPLTIPR